jgi:hypothetical protein
VPAPTAVLAVLAVHPAVLAIAAPARTGLPWPAAAVLGVVVSIGVGWAVAGLAARLPESPGSAEARRVLLPAFGFGVVLALFVVTGAFHWASPVDVTRP